MSNKILGIIALVGLGLWALSRKKTTMPAPTGGVVTILPRGDVDGDGLVTANDAEMARQHLMGDIVLTADQLVRADVDGDGVVSITDVLMIEQMIAGEGGTPPPRTGPSDADIAVMVAAVRAQATAARNAGAIKEADAADAAADRLERERTQEAYDAAEAARIAAAEAIPPGIPGSKYSKTTLLGSLGLSDVIIDLLPQWVIDWLSVPIEYYRSYEKPKVTFNYGGSKVFSYVENDYSFAMQLWKVATGYASMHQGWVENPPPFTPAPIPNPPPPPQPPEQPPDEPGDPME